jgi:hypothetical protein
MSFGELIEISSAFGWKQQIPRFFQDARYDIMYRVILTCTDSSNCYLLDFICIQFPQSLHQFDWELDFGISGYLVQLLHIELTDGFLVRFELISKYRQVIARMCSTQMLTLLLLICLIRLAAANYWTIIGFFLDPS